MSYICDFSHDGIEESASAAQGNEMSDFSEMNRHELSAWYIENVGYDLGAEDPSMTLETFRDTCQELFELYNQA